MLHQCAPSGAGAREGRGQRVSSGSFSHPHPRSQPSPQAQRERPHPPVGGLDLNPQQSSSAPDPSRYIRVSGRGQPPGVPNTAGMFPGCWWGDPGLIPWPALGPVQIQILTPQRPGAHPRLTPRTSRAWWGLCPHLRRRGVSPTTQRLAQTALFTRAPGCIASGPLLLDRGAGQRGPGKQQPPPRDFLPISGLRGRGLTPSIPFSTAKQTAPRFL